MLAVDEHQSLESITCEEKIATCTLSQLSKKEGEFVGLVGLGAEMQINASYS